jgi:hypothetical protein
MNLTIRYKHSGIAGGKKIKFMWCGWRVNIFIAIWPIIDECGVM